MRSRGSDGGHRSVSAVLFVCLFAAQAGAIAVSPVLTQLAADLDVSTAVAGQLRTVAGLVAGVVALALARHGGRIGLGRQLLGGALLLALGSLGSAAAPSFALLGLAQVPVGAGMAVLTTAGTLAAAEWVAPERRAAALSWALAGQPAAWIVGMPLVGLVGPHGWRYAWLVLPLAAAVAAGAAVAGRAGEPPAQAAPTELRAALAVPGLARWLSGELLANTAWAATLVYSGPLIVQSYGVSAEVTGIVLAIGAGAHVAGNLAFRHLDGWDPPRQLVLLPLGLASTALLFGALRPSLSVTAVLFSAACFLAGARTFVSSAFALAAFPDARRGAMALRVASMQLGYFAGSLAAGAALSLGGYAAFGCVVGLLFAAAAGVRLRAFRVSVGRTWSFGFSARSR